MRQTGEMCRMQEQWVSWEQLLWTQNMLFHGSVKTGCRQAGKGVAVETGLGRAGYQREH